MPGKTKLHPGITEIQFDNGYWYAEEIKSFAKEIGIANSSRLRKDELETLIRTYLRTGKVAVASRKNLVKSCQKDLALGLSLDLPIVHYTSNKQTKSFIEREALKISPGLKRRSGARYRLNRWREEQLNKGKRITYGDLVKEYIRLNKDEKPFEKIPQVRYINFLADYLEREKGASRADALKAWHKLKKLDIPKDYSSWKKYKSKKEI